MAAEMRAHCELDGAGQQLMQALCIRSEMRSDNTLI
jgi:hypothetical protein